MKRSAQVTRLLHEIEGGNRTVVNELLPLLYEELKQIADRGLRRERSNHTLNATALVHEAYFKLVDQKKVTWQNRAHFLAIAAQAMRRILINYAQSRKAQKRGGGEYLATFDENLFVPEARAKILIDLDEALSRLREFEERQCKIIECRFFAGLNYEEIAEALGVSVPTIRRDWRLAKAWLNRELSLNSSTEVPE